MNVDCVEFKDIGFVPQSVVANNKRGFCNG
jgi:hypothetical protein